MKNILITGPAGAGKTTLIKRLCVIFKEFNPAGFVTSEIMEEGVLSGFEVSNLLGDSKIFAHTKFKSKVIAGKFKVDLKILDTFIENTFAKEKKTGLYVIDEICKIECSSKKFLKQMNEMLNSKKPVIATISDKGTGVISDIKKREDVRVFELTEQNRELKLKELTMIIRDLLLE
jgi:nucleoside-triphosphatase THEP1